MRSADARSAEIDRPDGVARTFQVSVNKVEPREAVSARNLLSHDEARTALADEAEELGPEVAVVVEAAALASCAEWLAWAGAGPDRNSSGPSGEPQGEVPSPDASEEMHALEPGEIHRSNIAN